MTAKLADIVGHLDRHLRVAEVPDEPGALNGLQVENSGSVTRVAAAVDACQATIDAAAAAEADLLIVHHGLFWGGPRAVVGPHWRRLRALISNDIGLYSAHIPLDCHPELGNNALLARALELSDTEPFGDYRGVPIGVAGSATLARSDLIQRLARLFGSRPHLIAGGPKRVARVGVITGGGGSMVQDARAAGIDTFVTGEGAHHTHFDAEEGGINVIYAGHYNTETFGVKALAAHLEERFGLPWDFLDHPTGL